MSNSEDAVNQEINELISQLRTLYQRKDPLVKFMDSFELVEKSFEELRDMIEMVQVKRMVISQIKFLLVNIHRGGQNLDGHMLHTVISGKPGTGKTTVAMILCRIWMSLGFIQESSGKEDPQKETIRELLSQNLQKSIKIGFCARKIRKNKESLDELSKNARKFYRKSNHRGKPYPSRTQLNNTSHDINYLEKKITDTRNNLDTIYRHLNAAPINFPKETPKREPKMIKATRADLVGEYIGQTSAKTKAVLEKALGGVLLIDEAYSLINGSSKDFGHEALALIIEYMSLYPNQLVVIFSGYKDKLDETIFKAQPGLARRCAWHFNIEEYSASGLARIGQSLLNKNGWEISPKVNFTEFIQERREYFVDEGGSVEKFVLYCKFAYSEFKFQEILSQPDLKSDGKLTLPILKKAFESMQANHSSSPNQDSTQPIFGMYL